MRVLYLIFIWGLLSYVETCRRRRSTEKENCECGTRNYLEALIMDGEPVEDTRKFPWLVPIRSDNHTRFGHCGGSIISPHCVLTAGHCLGEDSSELLQIGLKGENTSRMESRIDAEEYIVHPEYELFKDGTAIHDVALIKTATAIPCSDFNKPICLPKENLFQTDDDAIVSGWGASNIVHIGLVDGASKIVSNDVCSNYSDELREQPADVENIICVEGNPATPCYGDSGSPLQFSHEGKFYAIGVASYEYSPACKAPIPTVYMNVARYYSFITEHCKDLPDA